MPLDRLLETLEDLPSEAGLFATVVLRERKFESDERPGGDFGPANFADYADLQREHLVKLRDVLQAAAEKVPNAGSALLFATGSLARLEYLAGSSDIDLLGLATGASRLPADVEAELVRQFEDQIRLAAEGVGESLDISIAGIPVILESDSEAPPSRRGKMLFSKDELINFAGKEYEASWAGIERGSLIFESVLVHGEQADADDVRSQIDERLYRTALDLSRKRFPLVGYSLLQFLARSSLLAKFALIRGLTGSRITEETAKVVVARVCSHYINLLMMHVLYWNELLAETGRSPMQILADLRSPPIWKAMRHIPCRLEFLQEDDHCRGRLFKILGDKGTADGLYEDLAKIWEQARFRGSDQHVPLWYRFSQVIRLGTRLRNGEVALDSKVISLIKKWTGEMENLIAQSAQVSHTLALQCHAGDDPMRNLHDLLGRAIHGDVLH